GLVQRIARGLRPIMRRLFPDVPPEHPAMGSMVMNMSANMLGLGNAATPLGLRAMRDLETLNPRPGVATNAMCTFLAINTSSVQLVPTTAIAILAAAGSTRPTAIVGTALLATLCAASVAIISVKLLEKLPVFRLEKVPVGDRKLAAMSSTEAAGVSDPSYSREAQDSTAPPSVALPMRRWGLVALIGLGLLFVAFFVRMVAPTLFGLPLPAAAATQNVFVRSVNALSILA